MRPLLTLWLVCLVGLSASEQPHHVTWTGEPELPGSGKHIVYIANGHYYRPEETCAALARIMAKHYGFTCTLVTGIDPDTGSISPGIGVISGLEVLNQADLVVIGLRLQTWATEEMHHFVNYLNAGKPIIGLRASTHAFKITDKTSPFAHYHWKHKGEDYPDGFGSQVLGEHWVGHYGDNHKHSNLLHAVQEHADHPILIGVTTPIHAVSGGYNCELDDTDHTTVLCERTVLNGMTADSPPSQKYNASQPAIWVRHYAPETGADPYSNGRVLCDLHGSSEDILDDNHRHLLINAHLWCLQMEDAIKPDNPIEFVGAYHPTGSAYDGYRQNVKPSDIAGFDAPIFDPEKPVGEGRK